MGPKNTEGAQKGLGFDFSIDYSFTRCAGAEHNDSAWARAY